MANCGGVDAAPRARLDKWQLAIAGEHVAYLLPVDEVATVVERNARRKFETARDQIIIGVHPANTRIRMETRDNRIIIAETLSGGTRRRERKKRT